MDVRRTACNERSQVTTNTNPASTLAADLLRYADLIEDELVAGRPRKMGDAADCASPIMRQAAAALRASTPSAAPVAVGPRESPDKDHILFVLYEIGRFARGVTMGKAVHGLCPAGCGCLWRDNFDGTMSLGYNQRSCKTCEPLPFDKLIPLYAHPPTAQVAERQPLTDERVNDIWDTHVGDPTARYPIGKDDFVNFARAIERAHGISASGEGKSHE